MQITDIKFRRLFDDEGPLKAVLSVTFDQELALHDVKVIYAGDHYFVVMPCKKAENGGYRDVVHPINADFRSYTEATILDAYHIAAEERAKKLRENKRLKEARGNADSAIGLADSNELTD
jgi:stage V sporulation protein G